MFVAACPRYLRIALVALLAVAVAVLVDLQAEPRATEATVPGGNGKIAFAIRNPVDDSEVHTVNADGTGEVSLIASNEWDWEPAWSADGQSLAFIRRLVSGGGAGPSGGGTQSDIWIADADGTNQRQLTTVADAANPSWSPDGTKITFDRQASIAIVDVETGAVSQLTTPGVRPAWSPDGTRIAFDFAGIFVATLDGAVTQLTSGGGTSPTWSPDGTEIGFDRGFSVGIAAVNVEDATVRTILPNGASPAWSPEGDRIAYIDSDGVGVTQIYTVNVNDGDVQQITSGPGLRLNPDWQPLPLRIDSVEFTQAIQELQTLPGLKADLAADGKPPVPMIAGKPAVLRVYAEEVDETTTLTFEASGAVNATEDVTLQPGCTPEQRRKQENNCRSVDFHFTPPQGAWSVNVKVKMAGQVVEEHDFGLTSVEADSLTLNAVSVCDAKIALQLGVFDEWECGDPARLFSAASLLRRMLPADDVDVTLTGTRVTQEVSQFAQSIQWWGQVDRDLQAMHSTDDALSGDSGFEVYYYGMARNAVPSGILGAAYINTRGAASKENWDGLGYESGQWVVAHEMGHAMGLDHTDTAVPALSGSDGCWLGTATNLAWPWADNKLRSGASADDVEVGFDVSNQTAIPGDDYYDFSGYCSSAPPSGAADVTVWISPFTFNQLLEPTGPLSVSSIPQNAAPVSAPGDFWLIGGQIDDEGSVEFDPLVTLGLDGAPVPGPGTHRLEVRDAGSGVLYTRAFTPADGHGSPSPGDEVLEAVDAFSELIPVQQDAAVIEVFDASDVSIGQIALGGAPPVVTIEQPTSPAGAGAALDISWSVEDPDSAEHTFWVDYSADGGATWQNQAMGLTAAGIGLDAAMLTGSDSALIRVIASDGVNSGEAVSDPFSVAKKLPEAEIIGPARTSFRLDDLVWLEAAAWDIDDGTLDDGAVTWSSSRDGTLGTGNSLPVYDLSEGTHTITLTAEDSDGNEVSDSIAVTIVDKPIVEGEVGIKGDVDCDDDVDSVDGLKVLLRVAGLPVSQEPGCPSIGSGDGAVFGNIDCDDSITSLDGLFILRFVAALPVNLPDGYPAIGT